MPLDGVAAALAQEVELLVGLHAFGGDPLAQAAREADHRGGDGTTGGPAPDVRNEGPVDLHLVEREVAQV